MLTERTTYFPFRSMHEPLPEGPSAGRYVPQETLDLMLDTYYEMRGWMTMESRPMKKTC
ncbi:MAG: aldehyde ferredoxin oxidoreductase C-terminal domain-containing protein [Candidatus Bathyarchaeia archaeon]